MSKNILLTTCVIFVILCIVDMFACFLGQSIVNNEHCRLTTLDESDLRMVFLLERRLVPWSFRHKTIETTLILSSHFCRRDSINGLVGKRDQTGNVSLKMFSLW